MEKLTLTYLGTAWMWHGSLFYMSHPDGREARVFVDSIGETWVDIRRIPEGGPAKGFYFPSERVTAYRALNGAAKAETALRDEGFGDKKLATENLNGIVKERDF